MILSKSIAFDTSGIMWVGTIGGLARFDGTNWTDYTIFNSPLVSDNIAEVYIDHLNRENPGDCKRRTGDLRRCDLEYFNHTERIWYS